MGGWHGARFSRHFNVAGFNPLEPGKKTSTDHYYWHSFNTSNAVLRSRAIKNLLVTAHYPAYQM